MIDKVELPNNIPLPEDMYDLIDTNPSFVKALCNGPYKKLYHCPPNDRIQFLKYLDQKIEEKAENIIQRGDIIINFTKKVLIIADVVVLFGKNKIKLAEKNRIGGEYEKEFISNFTITTKKFQRITGDLVCICVVLDNLINDRDANEYNKIAYKEFRKSFGVLRYSTQDSRTKKWKKTTPQEASISSRNQNIREIGILLKLCKSQIQFQKKTRQPKKYHMGKMIRFS